MYASVYQITHIKVLHTLRDAFSGARLRFKFVAIVFVASAGEQGKFSTATLNRSLKPELAGRTEVYHLLLDLPPAAISFRELGVGHENV